LLQQQAAKIASHFTLIEMNAILERHGQSNFHVNANLNTEVTVDIVIAFV
jgi:hypothetical protein